MKDDLSQKIHEIFLYIYIYICINATNMILPSVKKSKDNLLPKNYT